MTLVLPLLSLTASTTVPKTRLRSTELPGFCIIPHASRPFFKQWCIHTIDVIRIMSIPFSEARQVVSELRSIYGKSKRESITVEEFCEFTGIGKSIVRMHLLSRAMEGELRKLGNE
ncbi:MULTISPECIES: hypothetical protein [Niastella]|uniref:Uncharacterized protein n=1 Tax=Niastella soli TaxID=2821487 RepID=A0ABS3Z3L4_9BACT|nr:hypothetical protein [Niastella soli]MBO9204751.1 hypothetical protein [Niastella soli]